MNARTCHLQLRAAVRLRREKWGGMAFDRSSGDLIEVDAEAFEVLTALKTPRTVLELERHPGRCRPVRRLELRALLGTLERRGFIGRVAPDAQPLPADRWQEPVVG